jgi:tRNA A37 threonylcarbamoyladenosine modification protein TsaB
MSEKSILSVYTDSEHGYVALKSGDEWSVRESTWTKKCTQSSGIIPLLEQVRKNYSTDDVGVVVAAKGPASFTSLRITLIVAKTLLFCSRNAKPFSPSHLHVLAFAAMGSIPADTKFVVLADAFNRGFYSAVFYNSDGVKCPVMLSAPAFYDSTTYLDFFTNHRSLAVVKNFPQSSFCENFLIYTNGEVIIPSENLAEVQIKLYEQYTAESTYGRLSVKKTKGAVDGFDYNSLTPLYLNTPEYKKIGKFSHV